MTICLFVINAGIDQNENDNKNENEDECEEMSAPVPCMLANGQNALLVNLGKRTTIVA